MLIRGGGFLKIKVAVMNLFHGSFRAEMCSYFFSLDLLQQCHSTLFLRLQIRNCCCNTIHPRGVNLYSDSIGKLFYA